jgi:hypothetical protein
VSGALVFHREYGVGRLIQIGDSWQTSAGDVSVAFCGFGHRIAPPCLPQLIHHSKLVAVPGKFGMSWILSGKVKPGNQLIAPDPNLLEKLRSREIYRPQGRAKDLPSGPSVSPTALLKPAPYAAKVMDWLYFMRPPYVHHHTTKGRSKEQRFVDRRGVPFKESLNATQSVDWEYAAPYRTIIYPPAVFKRDLKRRAREDAAHNRCCAVCGEFFEAKRIDARFCSAKCRKASSRECHR